MTPPQGMNAEDTVQKFMERWIELPVEAQDDLVMLVSAARADERVQVSNEKRKPMDAREYACPFCSKPLEDKYIEHIRDLDRGYVDQIIQKRAAEARADAAEVKVRNEAIEDAVEVCAVELDADDLARRLRLLKLPEAPPVEPSEGKPKPPEMVTITDGVKPDFRGEPSQKEEA